MKQSRKASFLESAVNIIVGLGLSLLMQAYVLPALGVPMPWSVNLAFAGVMTVVSISRSFTLRRLFEALNIRLPLSPAMQAVIAERFRQIDGEGWSAEHDDAHGAGDLAQAGAAYAMYARWHLLSEKERCASRICGLALSAWPWDGYWWKPRDFRRDLVRGAALIIAEIDKFDRSKTRRGRPAEQQP